jgi:hypothetical protein
MCLAKRFARTMLRKLTAIGLASTGTRKNTSSVKRCPAASVARGRSVPLAVDDGSARVRDLEDLLLPAQHEPVDRDTRLVRGTSYRMKRAGGDPL